MPVNVQSPPGMRPAPTRSRILSKFGKAKAMNPFAEEEKRAIQNMTEGTSVCVTTPHSFERPKFLLCLIITYFNIIYVIFGFVFFFVFF